MTTATTTTTPCPTPKKSRFATTEAALGAAERPAALGKRLRPYTCACGWVHLTKRHADVMPPTTPEIEAARAELAALDQSALGKIVRDDALGRAVPVHSAALRHPDLVHQWRAALKILNIDIANQILQREDRTTPEGRDWRRRAQYLQQAIAQRRTEAGTITATRRSLEMHNAVAPDRKAKRAIAGEIAIGRLIAAHREDFDRYLIEECAAIDVPPPLTVLERQAARAADTTPRQELAHA